MLSLGTTRTENYGIEVIRRVGPCSADGVLRHTVIVAGQHGCEIGPVLALASLGYFGLTDYLSSGLLTIVRAANPYGIARGVREDASGADMNRGWVEPLRGVQASIWSAVLDGERAYGEAGTDCIVERVVVDMHSSCISGNVGRTVISMQPADELAVQLAALLDIEAHRGEGDDHWKAISLEEASRRANVRAAGSLMEYATEQGSQAVTVEFPESTFDCASAASVEAVTGERLAICGGGDLRFRQLSVAERMRGVIPLLRSLVRTRHSTHA